MTGVDIVFRDLEDSLKNLVSYYDEFKLIRREFAQFVNYSQQITEAMRKEFKAYTGLSWEAKQFSGWNNVTSLFKELRKADFHESPITIIAKEKKYYLVEEIEIDGHIQKCYMELTAKIDIGNPFSEKIKSKVRLELFDEDMKTIPDVEPEKVEFEFYIKSSDKGIQKLLDEIKNTSIIELCTSCFEVLEAYYKYYKDCKKKFKKPPKNK